MASACGAAKHSSVAIAIPLPIAPNLCMAFPLSRRAEKAAFVVCLISRSTLVVFGQRREAGPSAAFALIGAAVLTGLDRHVEAGLATAMPDRLTAFATSL